MARDETSTQPGQAKAVPGIRPTLLTIGYLTSAYARASDTFIRGEVAVLRDLGHTVHTFSIRRPGPDELVDEEVRREHASTEFLLAERMALAFAQTAIRSPRRLLGAARLAVRVSTPGLKGRLWPLAYLLEAAYLAELLQAKRVQHLHNHIGENSAAVAMIAAAIADIPYSLTIHGPGEFDRPAQLALGEKVRRASFVATVSNYSRSQLLRWTDRADWSKIHIIHCGVDDGFLRGPQAPIPREPRLLSVGRLVEQKGHLLLVEAMGRLVADGLNAELILVGDGPLRQPIERRIAELGLEGSVRITGWLGEGRVRDEILRSRALVLPSFAEGLPVAIMESLALQRPVISTYIAGIPELVQPGANGWLVPPGSVEDLADAMRSALTAPTPVLERMGRNGALRVAELHNRAVEVGKLVDLISAHVTPSAVARG